MLVRGGARVVLLEKAAVRRSGSTGVGIGNWHGLLAPGTTLKDIAKNITTGGGKLLGTRNLLAINRGLVDENLTYFGDYSYIGC